MKLSIQGYIVAFLASVILALCGSTWYFNSAASKTAQIVAQQAGELEQYQRLTQAQSDALKAAEALQTRTTKALTVRAEKADKLGAEYKEQNRVLAQALRDSAGWSDSLIPDGVLSALKSPAERRNP